MSRLEDTLKKHCPSMDALFLDKQRREFRERIFEAMKEYAKEVAQASLEKASKAAEVIEPSDSDYCPYVDKESITNESNIVLL